MKKQTPDLGIQSVGTQGGSEDLQEIHYNEIAEEYASHYGDPTAKVYRDRFIYNRMFGGLDLKKLKVLDAMCGMGTTSEYLLRHGADVTALDISDELLKICNKVVPGAKTVKASVLNMPFPDESFDVISIVGGLHHLHPKVEDGVSELFRVLKSGGILVCLEPPKESIFDRLRQFWYRFDRYFEDNEESIDLKSLVASQKGKFTLEYQFYGNGPAYFLICNSLIMRIPLSLKKIIAYPLFFVDRCVEYFTTPFWAAYVVFRLRKV